ncbi:putative F-box protein AFR [Cocos nucifera]|uniref:Putative F-box protein AFR n=1 Tax=Cocos nucifera TaxID=13894 RepID=A0A8K0INW3_COCNU|nr:putative F-box protein AFR [Cocos nucifera]
MAWYNAVVVGRRMFVMEGWWWPFCAFLRAGVYKVDQHVWEEMSKVMWEGWTGASIVVGDRLIITNYGDGRVKAYDAVSDAW